MTPVKAIRVRMGIEKSTIREAVRVDIDVRAALSSLAKDCKCDQIEILFLQYLAIYNTKHLL